MALGEGRFTNFLTQGFHRHNLSLIEIKSKSSERQSRPSQVPPHKEWNVERVIKAGVLGEMRVIFVMKYKGYLVNLWIEAEEEEVFVVGVVEMGGSEIWVLD